MCKLILPLIQTLLSVGTLILAYEIYKNFDVKKNFMNKQLTAVCDLSKQIINTEIWFYTAASRSSSFYKGNIYSIIHVIESSSSINLKLDTTLYVEDMYSLEHIFPFLTEQFNPLMPRVIASKLYMLSHITSPKNTTIENFTDPKLLLLRKNELTEIIDPKINIYYYKSFLELKKETNELRAEIVKWFKKYGADESELNI